MQIIVKHVNTDLQLTLFPHCFPASSSTGCWVTFLCVLCVCIMAALGLQPLHRGCLLQEVLLWLSATVSADKAGLCLEAVPWVFTVQLCPRWHCSFASESGKVGEGSCSRSVQGRTFRTGLEARCIADGACSRLSWSAAPVLFQPLCVLPPSHAHLWLACQAGTSSWHSCWVLFAGFHVFLYLISSFSFI